MTGRYVGKHHFNYTAKKKFLKNLKQELSFNFFFKRFYFKRQLFIKRFLHFFKRKNCKINLSKKNKFFLKRKSNIFNFFFKHKKFYKPLNWGAIERVHLSK